MREIEIMLRESGRAVREMAVPEELEGRLRRALQKRKKKKPYGLVAAAVVALLFMTYNFSAIAYYARQFIGFDNIMSGTLRDLNELGRGQIIDRGYTFSDGTEFILEGVMVDDNQLVAFVTENYPEPREYLSARPLSIKGFLKRYHWHGGVSEFSADRTTAKSVYYFDPPALLARNLAMELFYLNREVTETGRISFSLDRNKAMGFSIKERIDRTIMLGHNSKLRLDTVTVSPMITLIEGILELDGDHAPPDPDSGYPDYLGLGMELKLFADNREVESRGGHLGGRAGKYKFSMEFDTLFADVSAVEIVLTGLPAHQDINRAIELIPGDQNMLLELEGNEIVMKSLAVSDSGAILTLLTKEKYPIIELACLYAGGVRAPLLGIGGGDLCSGAEDSEAGGTLVEWQLEFAGLPHADRYLLDIERINYMKRYHESVIIPIQ